MIKQVVWSPSSSEDLEQILFYIDNKWGRKVASDFVLLIDELINQIILNPGQFPEINIELKVRKCVVTKHNTLFYRFNENRIEVLRIFDTRQDPRKLKFK